MNTYEQLRLKNQLYFPLYACAKEVVRRYKPLLDPLDLTYTQYIAMMVLWEEKEISVKELGERLYLDSGTMTPVLKKLEAKGFLTRTRSQRDERNVVIRIADGGEELKEAAAEIPAKLSGYVTLLQEEAVQLYGLLYKLLG